MKKITRQSVAAYENNKEFRSGNMRVSIENDTVTMYLHDNAIARKRITSTGMTIANTEEITNAGWLTNTTKERLNGLDGVSIYQKNLEWFLNGKKWNGEWTLINQLPY